MGWRYLLFTLGAITTLVFFLRFFIFDFRETPKYLIYRGKDAQAIQTMQHVSKVNGKQCLLTIEQLEALNRSSDESVGSETSLRPTRPIPAKATWKETTGLDLSRYRLLFSSWRMTRLTVLTWLTYAMDFWGFTVAGHYLPRILALKNGAASVSLQSTYTAYVYTYAPGVIGVLLGAVMYKVPSIGQKWTMVLSAALMGVSIFLFSIVDTVAKNEGMFAMEYFFQSMFNAVLYGWTPQAFPASVRGAACGVASFWGRLAGVVSPLIAQHLYGNSEGGDVNAVLYLAGGVTLGCVLSVALLPSDLMETTDEEL